MGKRRAKMSDQLRRIIDECGATRYRIAQETNIDEATLSRFMSGERGLSMKALDRIGKYLDLEVVQRKRGR